MRPRCISTTPGHPIWTWARDGELVDVACTIADEQEGLKYVTNINGSRKQAESGWTFASDIKPGQWTAGTTSPQGVVARVRSMDAPGTRVYNFGVQGTRTYFVSGTAICGSPQPVWVHNTHRKTSKTRAATPKEGRYEFPDKKADNLPYVGESKDIPKRLKQHERAGRLEPGTEKCKEVLGGKTPREVDEFKRIQEITGGRKAKNSDKVANKKDPIGPQRRPGLGLPEPKE